MRKRIPGNYFTKEEWEMLCDCCGMCCLYKIQDEDTNEILFTRVMCPYMKKETARCACYPQRFERMPSCTKISLASLRQIAPWLPYHCAYRCVFENRLLPDWHPLFSDESPEAETLRQKLSRICLYPGAPYETRERISELIRQSVCPDPSKDLDSQLIENVIEDIH